MRFQDKGSSSLRTQIRGLFIQSSLINKVLWIEMYSIRPHSQGETVFLGRWEMEQAEPRCWVVGGRGLSVGCFLAVSTTSPSKRSHCVFGDENEVVLILRKERFSPPDAAVSQGDTNVLALPER